MNMTSTYGSKAIKALTVSMLAILSVSFASAATVRIGRGEDSTTMDPIKTTQNVDIWVINNVHAFLIRANRTGDGLEADLAESWDVSDDKLTFTFHLRDAKFSDGSTVKASDAVFSIKRLRDNEESTQSSLFKTIESVTAPDAKKVVIKLSQPSAAFLSTLAMYAASILPEQAVTKLGKDYGSKPVSAGMYQVAEWRRGEFLALKPNPHYWGGQKSKVDRVEWRVVPDDNTRVLQVQAGELDVAMGVPFSMLPALEKDARVQLHLDVSTREDHLLLNHENKLLANKRVRQAINMGINTDAIIKVVTFGRAKPANSMIPAGTLYYNPNNKDWPYDPEKAKKIIEEEGATGAKFNFVIGAGYKGREQTAVIIQQQLKKIGLEVVIKKIDPGQVWSAFVDGGYDMAPAYWTYDILDPDQKIAFSADGDSNKSYYTRYKNPEVTELINQARLELDTAKRAKLYADIQRIVKEDAHWVDLYYSPFSNVSRKGITGFYQNPMGVIPLHEISVQ